MRNQAMTSFSFCGKLNLYSILISCVTGRVLLSFSKIVILSTSPHTVSLSSSDIFSNSLSYQANHQYCSLFCLYRIIRFAISVASFLNRFFSHKITHKTKRNFFRDFPCASYKLFIRSLISKSLFPVVFDL